MADTEPTKAAVKAKPAKAGVEAKSTTQAVAVEPEAASKKTTRPFMWAIIAGAVVILALSLIAVAVKSETNKSGKKAGSTAVQSEADKEIAARDGKTEQITLLSQKGSFPYSVEIASTEASRTQGLSGRDGLQSNTGMLFIFSEPGFDCFWMKDMKFDIDMLWFDEYQSLVHVQDSASKSTYPSSFCPQSAARYVLEVPAGTVKELGLQLGDRFTMQQP